MTETESLLSCHGYYCDTRTGIWRRSEGSSLAYSDGEQVELRIKEAIESVSDRSVDSPEWSRHITDWPTEYHLSPVRSNLLRPLPICQGQLVVEMGAGCGAISRWLGETGANVIAVEGSSSRAEIAALRCKDLPNVLVVNDNVFDLPSLASDWCLLIGVLEYARVYSQSADAVRTLLRAAANQLNCDGALVVAIENQLGLKYFAGCGEDHLAVPFLGLHDQYSIDSAVTFGRAELQRLITDSGLPVQRMLLPFPDYKLPEVIVDSSSQDIEEFDLTSFIGFSETRDYSGPRPKAFSEALAWRPIRRNGLVEEFSNSFLAIATQSSNALARRSPDRSLIGWSFSGQRFPEFIVDTTIHRSGDKLGVSKCLRHPASKGRSANLGRWSHVVKAESEYFEGQRLDALLLHLALNAEQREFFDQLTRWFRLLVGRSCVREGGDTKLISSWICDGGSVDLIPRNIVVNSAGEYQIFDQEWKSSEPVPLVWLLVRGILSFVLFARGGTWVRQESVQTLASATAALEGIVVSQSDLVEACECDGVFLSWVRALPVDRVLLPLELITRPICELVPSLVELAKRGSSRSASSSSQEELQSRLESERVAHIKLIGAYEVSEKSNQSLIDQLAKAHAYAARETELHVATRTALEEARFRLQAAIAERDGAKATAEAEYGSRIRELVEINGGLVQTRDAAMREIVVANESEAQAQARVHQLEEQFAALNRQVNQLNAERATIGAAIGRKISRLRAAVAPNGSLRERVLARLVRFALISRADGVLQSLSRTGAFLLFKSRSLLAQTGSGRMDFAGGRGTEADRGTRPMPELSADEQFAAWIAAREPSPERLESQKAEAGQFSYAPLISVILPVYRVPRQVLEETLASLESQTYRNWQACVVWADVEDDAGWHWLECRVGGDARFSLSRLVENGGISRNSNAALDLAKGEFLALLDHDDVLAPWAFFDFAKLLQTERTLDFIYSDKDSITADGASRINAYFKPTWSPQMLHSVNYPTHLNLIRTSLVRDIGGWRPETDGAQDWDLFFRVTERTDRIARLPSIHYHWRVLPTSTASGMQAKPYAAQGQLRAQRDHFERCGLPAMISPTDEGMFHVEWPATPSSIDVAVFQTGSMERLRSVLDALRSGKAEVIGRLTVLCREAPGEALRDAEAAWNGRLTVTVAASPNWLVALQALAARDDAAWVVIDGGAAGVSTDIVQELAGWVLHHPDISWCGAIAVDAGASVYEAGRVVAADGRSAPLFAGSALFHFGWFGGASWYRNSRACSPYAVAFRPLETARLLRAKPSRDAGLKGFVELCVEMLAAGRRGLIDPFARVTFDTPPESLWPNDGDLFRQDPYFHPAFARVSPLRLRS